MSCFIKGGELFSKRVFFFFLHFDFIAIHGSKHICTDFHLQNDKSVIQLGFEKIKVSSILELVMSEFNMGEYIAFWPLFISKSFNKKFGMQFACNSNIRRNFVLNFKDGSCVLV